MAHQNKLISTCCQYDVSRFKSISEMMDVDELEVDAKSKPKGSTLSLNPGRHEV